MEDDRSNGHDLDLEKADRPVWLMKSPVVVAKAWEKHGPSSSSYYSSSSLESPNLAKVVLSVDPLRSDPSPSPEFTMDMSGAEYGNMPKSYALNMFKDFVPMEVFSDVHQVNLAAEGKIEHKFDMKPHGENIEEYARLCRERTSKAMVKNRQIQVIDHGREGNIYFRPLSVPVGLTSSNSKDKKRPAPVKQTEVKRTRRDRGELEAIMFKLFEGQPNWTLKQLIQETDQPAQFLKEILNELCVYNKRGSNQGTYELKPEYKKAAEEDTGGQ
ncbi:unnamed protein product [Thlaspi arvense]|uniref:TFIIF beta subunit HTH domain-containing protein n=1 Tax=Thlaspi arvense TaxID=13288 RepID=A0AAU9SJB9_THLAR|nr:unnamed protein product [Thlaspi arvense]